MKIYMYEKRLRSPPTRRCSHQAALYNSDSSGPVIRHGRQGLSTWGVDMTDTGAAAWDIPTGTTCTCGTVVGTAARGEVNAECSFLADLKRFLGSLEGLKKVTYMYFIEVLWYNTIPGLNTSSLIYIYL